MSQPSDPPRPLRSARSEIESQLADAEGVLCCLDFDGTLAPIVDDPDTAAPLPAVEEPVARLADAEAVTTAVVSGRGLADVRKRVDGPAIYAGNHGLEIERDGTVAVHPLARRRATTLDVVCGILTVILRPIDGSRVENKGLTAAIHTREVAPPLRPIVRDITRRVFERHGDGLEYSTGKQVIELGPAIPWGKGNAVTLIAAALPASTLTIYLGDDVTDESAFEAIEPDGIGIRVGPDEPSAASVRLADPAAVADFLAWLAGPGLDAIAEEGSRP